MPGNNKVITCADKLGIECDQGIGWLLGHYTLNLDEIYNSRRLNLEPNSAERIRPTMFWRMGKHSRAFLRALAAVLLLVMSMAPATAGTLAPDRTRLDETMMAELFPGADSFGAVEGTPPAIPALIDGKVVGYVFSSRQVVQSTGYGTEPLDTLVGMTVDGIITGAVVVEHHEPLLIIGIQDEALVAFTNHYVGVDVRKPFHVAPGGTTAGADLDAIFGATLSSLVISDSILRSARSIAASRGLLGERGTKLDFESFEPLGWADLVREGSVRSRDISVGEAGDAIRSQGGKLFGPEVPVPDRESSFIHLYAALATPARAGRNLLGDWNYNRAMSDLAAGDQLFLIAGRGLYSFKGHAYRRHGQFDRIRLVQGARTYRFQREDHKSFEKLTAAGAPEMREIGLFSLKGEHGFDPSLPWRLQILVSGAGGTDRGTFALFELPYQLPDLYVKPGGGQTAWNDRPIWIDNWLRRSSDIVILILGLLILSAVLVFQDWVAKRPEMYRILRTGFLLFTLIWIGWIAKAQLSVINVLTFGHALMHDFKWDFFLLEPLLFILWGYVAIALVFLGRGVFCGWLCPFGALQELAGQLAEIAHFPQLRLPFGLSERLWALKYIIFFGLFATFLYDPRLAFIGAEIEPFKTAIVLRFDREWPFVLFALGVLIASLFVRRVFCRYLCPLGGALALPARMRMFEWLKRRWQCGSPCQTCASKCPVQAIHPEGRINPNECIHCLNCQVNYYDDEICPPLVDRRRRRERAVRPDETPSPSTRKPIPRAPYSN